MSNTPDPSISDSWVDLGGQIISTSSPISLSGAVTPTRRLTGGNPNPFGGANSETPDLCMGKILSKPSKKKKLRSEPEAVQPLKSVKMPNKIKLTYFNGRGRAEVSRLMLAHKGVEYEDCRLTGEQWGELKPKTPFGGLPLLQYNGLELAQSITIARFLARELNLSGKTRMEEAQVDMVVDCVVDLFGALLKAVFEKDETKKAELMEKMQKETVPTAMSNLEAILAKNGGKFMVGNDVTWADFEVSNFFQTILTKHGEAAFGSNKQLLALTKSVMDMPNVKAWVEKRPKTDL